jgi:hypothetical protein
MIIWKEKLHTYLVIIYLAIVVGMDVPMCYTQLENTRSSLSCGAQPLD